MLKGCQQEEDGKEGAKFANALNAKGKIFCRRIIVHGLGITACRE